MSSERKRIKVLFIAGSGRSGSTLLSRMLNEIDGFFSAGELRNVWDGGMRQNWLCGCGVPFGDCEFWRRVMAEIFNCELDLEPEDVHRLARTLNRNVHLPFLAWHRLRSAAFDSNVQRYTEVLAHLYRAIHEQVAGDVIVDASKQPNQAYLLSRIPEIDLHVVHLVRDSRAVAYSWQRKKLFHDIHWEKAYMTRYNPIRIGLVWNMMTYFSGLLDGKCSSFSILHYDDFVSDPRKSVDRIATQLGLPNPDLSFLDHDAVELGIIHAFSGNPNRFDRGTIRIKPDEEWKERMPKSHKLLVASLTFPYLMKHGLVRSAKRRRTG